MLLSLTSRFRLDSSSRLPLSLSLLEGLTIRRVLSLYLHRILRTPRSLLLLPLLLVSRSSSFGSVTSSRSTLAARCTLTREGGVERRGTSLKSRSPLEHARVAPSCPTRLVRPTDQQEGRSLPLLIVRTLSRLDALAIKSKTFGTGGQRRRREQEGESFVDKVRQQQSGSESDKGLGASNGNDDDDNRSGYERITSRFTVQETSLWR